MNNTDYEILCIRTGRGQKMDHEMVEIAQKRGLDPNKFKYISHLHQLEAVWDENPPNLKLVISTGEIKTEQERGNLKQVMPLYLEEISKERGFEHVIISEAA